MPVDLLTLEALVHRESKDKGVPGSQAPFHLGEDLRYPLILHGCVFRCFRVGRRRSFLRQLVVRRKGIAIVWPRRVFAADSLLRDALNAFADLGAAV